MRTRLTAAVLVVLAVLVSLAVSGGRQIAVGVGVGVLVLGIAAFGAMFVRRRSASQASRLVEHPSAELEVHASRALVETDDAVRASGQELGFAMARFGQSAAAPFSAALQSARSELAAAFKLRQKLDEGNQPESARRGMLAEISARCAEANRLLDEQSEAFGQLQNLQARAPAIKAEVDAHISQQTARLGRARNMLDQLTAKYTASAVLTVAANPGQAAERLAFARGRLAAATQVLASESADAAVDLLQSAESAADQACDLLDGILRREAGLTQASSALAAALREIDHDVADAMDRQRGRLDDEQAAVVARAELTAAAVRRQLDGGPFDTLAALRAVEVADAALDHVLAAAREERARHHRATAVLDQAMLVARSSVTTAEDFISTRRGAVRTPARTRLAEAHRRYGRAIKDVSADPEAALHEAQRADALAQQARWLAAQDVARPEYCRADLVGSTGFGSRRR